MAFSPKRGVPYLLSALSGVLVYASFPPFEVGVLAYFAFVPLCIATALSPNYRTSALCGLIAGCLAYLPAFWWLSSVTYGGWLFLSLYVAVYLLLFALIVHMTMREMPAIWPIAAACGWVGLEFVRSRFATGFPWLLMGYSQYRFTGLIQIATVTGVYGVSFLLVLSGVALAKAILVFQQQTSVSGRICNAVLWPGSVALAVILLALWGGDAERKLRCDDGPSVGVVQQNVPRLVEDLVTPPEISRIYQLTSDEVAALTSGEYKALREKLADYRDDVFGRIKDEIDKTVALSRTFGEDVDLVVWPETTVQEPLNAGATAVLSERARAMRRYALDGISALARDLNAYVLVGAPYIAPGAIVNGVPMDGYGPDATNNANSAYLFSPEGRMLEDRYDKMHLVPFGEYVPLVDFLPFLQSLTPMTRNLVPGKTASIFTFECPGRGNGATFHLATPICYEDVFPGLVRTFCRKGADFVVNITDEGWYWRAGELRQHLAMAVFRAVENRRTVVRAANTGISCFIGPAGDIYEIVEVEGEDGVVRRRNVAGTAAGEVKICDDVTLYMRFRDWFAWTCMVVSLGVLGWCVARRRIR